MKLALDLTHSSHSSAQTGIQQVARGLWRELPALAEMEPVAFDKYADFWRPLDARERAHLEQVDQRRRVKRKRPHWSTWQRLRGRAQRQLRRSGPLPQPPYDAVLLPEFFAEWVGPRLPELKRLSRGPMVAIFHDAIAFHEPRWGVRETIERYPQYLRELSAVDGVACVSAFSREQLLTAFQRVGVPPPRQVEVVPLGLRVDHLPLPSESGRAAGGLPVFLTVATIEPRKNHETLLTAAESLWSEGHEFRLVLVGMLNRGSAAAAAIETRIRDLQARGHALEWHGSVSAEELAGLYAGAEATVFPSLSEGFGLPILESLHFGKPCLASDGGALVEVATGPGVLSGGTSAETLTASWRRYLLEPGLAEQLRGEAQNRQVRTMRDYARDLTAWIQHITGVAAETSSGS